jgi:UDP:flavonoid glycosyltransferase YjiC (YdhE family)
MELPPLTQPLRIALSTVGSTGDMLPFIALGKGLQARGHEVIAMSHPFHAERFAQHGIPFAACGPMINQAEFNALLDQMVAHKNPVLQLRALLEEGLLKDGEAYFADVQQAIKGCDFAVCHMIDFLGHEAAARQGVPRASVFLTHAIVPTRVSTPALIPNLGPLNPFIWWVMTQTLSRMDRRVRRFLRQLGGLHIDVKRFSAIDRELNFLAASGRLAAVPDSALPANVKCTGPWVLQAPEVPLPAELEAFVARHPRPLIVSFGSMGGTRGPELTQIILTAIRELGIPAVIQAGYADLGDADLPGNVLRVGYLPHSQLFALGGCILHHGGAGTTMATLRAGVPSAVVAFIADQPYFADQLRKLGLAPKYIWSHRLNAKRLTRMLADALKPERFARAQELAPSFRAEDGVPVAIGLIESAAARKKAALHP